MAPEREKLQLRPIDRRMRAILWAGRHKTEAILWFGASFALFGPIFMSLLPTGLNVAALLLVMPVFFFLVGAALGWLFWHLCVWPEYAAFPGSTETPASVRVYEDEEPPHGRGK